VREPDKHAPVLGLRVAFNGPNVPMMVQGIHDGVVMMKSDGNCHPAPWPLCTVADWHNWLTDHRLHVFSLPVPRIGMVFLFNGSLPRTVTGFDGKDVTWEGPLGTGGAVSLNCWASHIVTVLIVPLESDPSKPFRWRCQKCGAIRVDDRNDPAGPLRCINPECAPRMVPE
jgi:hypothetical protein